MTTLLPDEYRLCPTVLRATITSTSAGAATDILDALRREAERVVLAIEAESRRIGLIT